ncbi:NACHT domain-containing protein [Streptomyces sp. TLI_55]|uniref:NACHT domain-containing protein n=1 Tax=Streptomyces sp. TLI_55 TaxID=1938861 RepID=UPI000BCF47B3|nr:NACHT domain-containing protein [Streptomyces sp. TLI_55]SNX63052.1 NACHT domain-containing protein [Streptomyces sp. TLI_55]
MDPAVLGSKLASSLMASLVRKLFAPDAPGAGLTDKPVRLSSLVSFRGEKRTLGEKEVRALARRMVTAATESPGEPPFPADEEPAVVDALTARLLALGDLDMDDVQAVHLGHWELARTLARTVPPPTGLSTDAGYFLDSATEWACLQILEFFTRRSTFVARTLVEQTRNQAVLIAKTDELLSRTPRAGAEDRAFERRYLQHIADRHNHITIYGIDLRDSPDRWPLEVAYLSLEATTVEERTLPEERPAGPLTVQLPAEDALLTHARALLRGDAGSGKTTLVQWLAVTAAKEAAHVPFVLPLRTLIRTGTLPTPAEFLNAVSCPLTPPQGWAERVLTAGRGLILIDGLDEIPAPDRTRTRDWLLALIHAFPGSNRWLLTSRPTAVRPDWLAAEGFHELLLAPMRRPEVATFVHRWHTAAEAPEYEGPLLDSLRTKRDLARLATNPLMCGLICALHRDRRGYLPRGREELYEAALTMLLTRRDRERGLGEEELGENAQLEVLQRLAYALVLSARTEMDVETAEAIVERCLPSISARGGAASVLRALLLRSGLLRQPALGVVDFVHRTFQDYLGARYAVEEGHLDVLLSHADDTQWEDVIRLAVTHARPRERAALLRQLLARETPRLTLLALSSLEHDTVVDAAVKAAVESQAAALIPPRTAAEAKTLAEAGPLVLELLPGPDGLTPEEALAVTVTASILGGEEPDGALAVLRRFREHPDLDVRRQLVGTWDRFDAEEYAVEVLDHLDRRDLFIICASAEQRAALGRMRPWPYLTFKGAHSAKDILASLPAPEALTELNLWDNPLLTDLSALLPLTSLDRLFVFGGPTLEGLDRLTTLTGLGFSDIGDISQLRSLRGIRFLSAGRLPGTALTDALPVDSSLEFLLLSAGATDHTGLRGLRHWATLRTLSLGPLTTELTVADWREVTELPELTHLFLNAKIIRDFPHSIEAMPELPGIEVLQIANMHGAEDLSPLVPHLPGLRSVTLHSRPGEPISPALYEGLFPGIEINLDLR